MGGGKWCSGRLEKYRQSYPLPRVRLRKSKDSFIEHLLQATHLRSGAPQHPQGDPGLGSLYVDLGPTS